MHNFIKNRLKQRGAALVEYAVLLSFVCAVGWSFVGSNNGMTGSIGSIIHSVERLLGMNGVVNVDKSNWINFEGKLPSEGLTLSGQKDKDGNWSWSNIWTDDDVWRDTNYWVEGGTQIERASENWWKLKLTNNSIEVREGGV